MLIIYDTLDRLLYTLRRPYFRKMENQDALVCISESIPEPTVEWVFCDSQSERYDGYRHNGFYDFTFGLFLIWLTSYCADKLAHPKKRDEKVLTSCYRDLMN